jgi:hypothetical protein
VDEQTTTPVVERGTDLSIVQVECERPRLRDLGDILYLTSSNCDQSIGTMQEWRKLPSEPSTSILISVV